MGGDGRPVPDLVRGWRTEFPRHAAFGRNDTLCTVVCKVSDRYMVRFHKDGQHRYVPVSRRNSWSLESSTEPDSLQSWSCSACTLLHKGDRATAAKCDACESPRRAEIAPAVARPRKKQPAVTSILAQAMAIPRKKIIARPPAPPPNKPKAPRKKNYNHPCIHGARCDYIQSGRDNCDFFHTAAEIELAAAKLAAAKLAAAKLAAAKTTVERVVPIPAAIVSFIIGKSGAHVQKMSSKSGAVIFVEVNTKSPDNFHNVRIQGNREQVEEGEKLVKEMVARFHPSRGSGPSEGASTNDNNSSIASGASSTQMPQVLVPHPTQMQLATQRTTALMADQAKTVASATSSVRVTGTFLPHPSQLHPAAKQTTVSYSSIASIPSVPTPREPDPVVTAPRASKRSSFEPAISRPTVAKSSLALTSKKQHSFDPTISKSRVVTPTSVMEHSSFHTAQAMRASEPKVVGPTLASSSAVALLAFLREHADCFKGSPEAFCEWLVGTEDICSLCDLADAASDDDYLRDVLQQGDGMSVGVKGFKRAAFQKAAMAARNNAKTTSNSADNDEPPAELMCPISHVLMTQDPVIAADGYTYERHAIEAWFQKQQLQVATARGQIAAGLNSHQAHAIIERGVLSPMTHTKLPHLLVLPNTAVRTMARDVAAKHAAESTNASDVFGACLLA